MWLAESRSYFGSETTQQPLEIIEFDRWPRRLAEPTAQLLENLAGALHIDFIGHLHRGAEVGAFGALRAAKRIARDIAGGTLPVT